uniref:Uncharacterized protein n=1 Tax=Aegilops tauschii subsp. strangulata TaxID=200361 RepID=A0A452ZS38_AEGTS
PWRRTGCFRSPLRCLSLPAAAPLPRPLPRPLARLLALSRARSCHSLSPPCLSLAPLRLRCVFSGSGHRAAAPTTSPTSWAYMPVTGRRPDREDLRSAPSFTSAGPVPEIRTAALLGPVRTAGGRSKRRLGPGPDRPGLCPP